MKKAAHVLAAALALGATPLLAQDPPSLPVPEGYVPLADSVEPGNWWLSEKSVRSNVPIVSAYTLSFNTTEAGQTVYVRTHFVAHCTSGNLTLDKLEFFSADQTPLGVSEDVQTIKDAADQIDTLESAIHKELCDRQ